MTTMTRQVLGAVLVTLLLPASAVAQETDARGPEAAVLDVVTRLFDGMREKDEALLRAVFHDEARLHTAGADDEGRPRVTSGDIESFIVGVLRAEAHLDEVTFDEVVLVDGNLATAWTPYNLFVDGEFRHCGVDAFTLVRTADGWKILQLVDTRTRTACDPGRRGR